MVEPLRRGKFSDFWLQHYTVRKTKSPLQEQAISRAYRSGQNRNVHTYHLVVQDSIEENIVIVSSSWMLSFCHLTALTEASGETDNRRGFHEPLCHPRRS